jgi:SPP1 family phage portal protein
VQSVDMELSRAQSLFGKGVELIYADKNVRPRSAALDPRCAFVVYDSTVAAEPLFGVLYRPITDESGRPTAHELNVYLEDSILTYRATNLLDLGSKAPDRVERHYFGRVPLIEYWNNDEETGDFECVLSLLDAYDAVQSDRLNDEEQLVNALLVITGAQLLPDEKGRSPAQQLRQDKLLYLPDRDASAQYLTRPNASADAETLRLALKSDIHKLCMVPDLSDEHFAGNASGVAMRYKLLGLEQLTRIKERWFREALRERLRIYARFLSVKGYRPLNADTVRMVFERSLPQDALETAQMVKTLEGMVPDEVLVSQLPFMEK